VCGQPAAASGDADAALGNADAARRTRIRPRDLGKQATEHIALRDAIGTGDDTTAIRLIDEHLDDGLGRLLARRATATAD
jgi:DNA-binding GntR family transcriptional regulator